MNLKLITYPLFAGQSLLALINGTHPRLWGVTLTFWLAMIAFQIATKPVYLAKISVRSPQTGKHLHSLKQREWLPSSHGGKIWLDEIRLRADSVSGWKLVFGARFGWWVIKVTRLRALGALLRSLIVPVWVRVRRSLVIIVAAPPVLFWIEPWMINETFAWDRPSPYSLALALLMGCLCAGIDYMNNHDRTEERIKEDAAVRRVNNALIRTGKFVDHMADASRPIVQSIKVTNGGNSVLLDPQVDIEKHGEEIAKMIKIVDPDATDVKWREPPLGRSDLLEVHTIHEKRQPANLAERPDLQKIRANVAAHPDKIWLGTNNRSGEAVRWDTKEIHHLLITGGTGGGKTVTIRLMALHAMILGWRTIVIDPKGGIGYTWMNELKNAELYTHTRSKRKDRNQAIDPKLHAIKSAISSATDTAYQRLDLIEKHNLKYPKQAVEDWTQYREMIDPSALPMLIVLDEVRRLGALFKSDDKKSELEKMRKELFDDIDTLISMMRAAGVHVVLATQLGDIASLFDGSLGRVVRMNFQARINNGYASASGLKMVLGVEDKPEEFNPSANGQAIFKGLEVGQNRPETGQMVEVKIGDVLDIWPQLAE